MTEWDEFRALNLRQIADALRGNSLIDFRNVYDRGDAEDAGLIYHSVGRGTAPSPTKPATERGTRKVGSAIPHPCRSMDEPKQFGQFPRAVAI